MRTRAHYVRLERAWSEAAGKWLPVTDGGPWRSSATGSSGLPRQGWKLHVSATIFNARETLLRVVPILVEEGAHFKAANTLADLKKLNCGLFYGYSQIGKFMTVYPRGDEECLRIVRKLAEATRGLVSPAVPFERRVDAGAPVFARYGLFQRQEGAEAQMLIGPNGAVPDERGRDPEWVVAPDGLFTTQTVRTPGLLATRFRAFDILAQRGKGGVYRAIDVGQDGPRLCSMKEGREVGEVDIDGRDGKARVAHEAVVLRNLAASSVPVPAIIAEFEEQKNHYLVLEWIDGRSLQEVIAATEGGLPVSDVIQFGAAAAELLANIHAAGWAWRDLKAANFILCTDGRLRPIDFEGAARVSYRVSSPWGSPGYMPPEAFEAERAGKAQDCYALGALLCHLLTGDHEALTVQAVRERRSDVDPNVLLVIEGLMAPAARQRLRAYTAAVRLKARHQRIGVRNTARALSGSQQTA